mmetsp:Transcript_6460/g.12788  ORF Transcript_6460/g.12788 Transcript_6460/m.12788 type:complete len:375 (-) Transcript_6460:989-2113(-)
MDPRVFRFKTFVDELVTVEKRQIVALTETAKDIVALDGRIAPQIANVVTDRALKASADVQLPILYLLDSICKNVGEPFVSCFSGKLAEVFRHAWVVGAPGLHRPLRKLAGTWVSVFPVHVMSAVEASMAHAGTIKPGGKKPMTRDPRLAGSDGVGQPPPVGDILSMLANTEDISSLLGVQVPVSALKSGEATTALDLKSDTIKVRNQAAISRLLNATRANQAAFLDNKFLKKKIYDGRKEHSRMWYLDIDTWYKGTTKNEEDSSGRQGEVQVAPKDEAPRLTSVPVDENQTECAVSGEKFEKYWDEKEQEWRYLDVVRVTGAMSARLGVPEGSLVCASTVDFGTIPSGMDTGQRRPAPIDNGGGDAKRIKIEKV